MAMTNSERGRMAAGVAGGVAVGAGTTVAGGWAITKAATAAARVAGPRAAVFIPGIGWVVGGAALAVSLYGGAKAAKVTADAGGNWKQMLTAGALGLAGVSPAAAQSVVQPAPIRRPGEQEIRRKQGQNKKKTDDKNAAPAPAPAPVQPAPMPAAPAASGKPLTEFEKRRQDLQRQLDANEARLNEEYSKRGGRGQIYDKIKADSDRLRGEMKSLAEEERRNDPMRIGFQIGLPAGALLAGGFAGNWFGQKAVAGAEAAGAKMAGQVEKLGKKAGELLKTSPKGVIAGTTAGDKMKAVVNEAYKIGGAKSAFPSPGYPSPPTPTALFDKPMGLPGKVNYVIPAANMAIGGAEIGASFMTDDPTTRMVLRSAGAGEFAMGFFQYKALANAVGVKPASTAIANIEAGRNRIARETATGMPAGVAQVKAGRNLDLAKVGAGRDVAVAGARATGAVSAEKVRAGGRVATTRMRANEGVVRAGASLGVAKADGAGRVARANTRNALGPQGYKNTWMDSRGRTYTRQDFSVRKAANGNSRSSRKAG